MCSGTAALQQHAAKLATINHELSSVSLESPADAKDQLRGAVLYGNAELDEDIERVLDVLTRLAGSNVPEGVDPETLRAGLRGTASKRVAIRVRPDKVVSWDHRKLGGRY